MKWVLFSYFCESFCLNSLKVCTSHCTFSTSEGTHEIEDIKKHKTLISVSTDAMYCGSLVSLNLFAQYIAYELSFNN